MRGCLLCMAPLLVVQLSTAYAQEAAANSGRIAVSNGRISIRAENVPLRQLLDEIRVACSVSLSAFPGAEAEMISAVIHDSTLEDGLRALLSRYDSIFLYSARDSRQ